MPIQQELLRGWLLQPKECLQMDVATPLQSEWRQESRLINNRFPGACT